MSAVPGVPCPSFTARGAGATTLVFLHGIGGDWTNFEPQLAAFADRYQAVAWTMPGYGDSPALPEMTFPALARAVVALLDRLGQDRVVLVGHSLGGMIAQEVAALYPDRLAALVAACTSPAFGKPGGDFQRQFLAARLAPLDRGETPADLAPGLVSAMVGADAPAAARAIAQAAMSRISAPAYRAALNCLVTFDRRAELEAIACPTLLISGGEDRTASPAVMERMASHIPAARYVCLDGAGHLANLERPEAFNAALAEFLATLEP